MILCTFVIDFLTSIKKMMLSLYCTYVAVTDTMCSTTRQMLQASWGASLTAITSAYILCVISVCYSMVTIATNE